MCSLISFRIWTWRKGIRMQAGCTWGMKRSGANEDTSSLPVISILDAELTYLPVTEFSSITTLYSSGLLLLH